MFTPLVFLAHGDDGRWHLGIGDPSLIGWFTVFAYLAAAYAAYRARGASNEAARMLCQVAPSESRNQRSLFLFWSAISVLLLALGLNKQLDLQSFFTEFMRDVAKTQGWYERRRDYQYAFILSIAAAAAIGTVGAGYFVRRIVARVWHAVVGVGFLLSFVVIRAASFHHMDTLLGSGDIKLNWILELSGIAMIGLAARRAERAVRPPGR